MAYLAFGGRVQEEVIIRSIAEAQGSAFYVWSHDSLKLLLFSIKGSWQFILCLAGAACQLP